MRKIVISEITITEINKWKLWLQKTKLLKLLEGPKIKRVRKEFMPKKKKKKRAGCTLVESHSCSSSSPLQPKHKSLLLP